MAKWNDLMVREMELQGYAKSTIESYTREVKNLVKFYMISPDELETEDVKAYLYHYLKVNKVQYSTLKISVSAIKYFYSKCCVKDIIVDNICFPKQIKKIPILFSRKEIKKMIDLSYGEEALIYMFAYSVGMRIGEIVSLRYLDLDMDGMRIHIKTAKGGKDRIVPLTKDVKQSLLELKRWSQHKDTDFIFLPLGKKKKLKVKQVRRWFARRKKVCKIHKDQTLHSFRHSFASHYLEDGGNIMVIKEILGHASLSSTIIYARLTKNYLDSFCSPLELVIQDKM
ncbi:MAG: tyrosine-type recombinase/integrase [Flavobacteriaceae bacterium]|nr:tyrosine-type recombinase/integrase [Flavobacteriaceae bacterium]